MHIQGEKNGNGRIWFTRKLFQEDFYSEIRAIRELMGNIDTFNPDKLIEKTGLLYVSCRDNDIAEICLGFNFRN